MGIAGAQDRDIDPIPNATPSRHTIDGQDLRRVYSSPRFRRAAIQIHSRDHLPFLSLKMWDWTPGHGATRTPYNTPATARRNTLQRLLLMAVLVLGL
jgi:hypothetical protein